MERYYTYQGFGEATDDTSDVLMSNQGGGIVVTSGKAPFYTDPDPVAAFLAAMQKVLGVPQTGIWDLTTHNAFWSWIMAREALTSSGGISDFPSVLPWKPQVCDSDGFPLGSSQVQSAVSKGEATMKAVVDDLPPVNPPSTWSELPCVDTAWLITEAMDDFVSGNQPFVNMLGWDTVEAMRNDGGWAASKDAIAIDLVRHIQAQLAAAPVTPPVPPPPVVVVTATSKPKPKTATVGWILGGLLFVGLLGVALSGSQKEG